MKCDVLTSSLLYPPSCAVLSRRSQTVFTASPLSTFPTEAALTDSVPSLSYHGSADYLRLSRDERNLAVTTNTLIKFIDLNTGRELRNLPAHSLAVKALCPRRNSIYSWISGSLDSSWVMWDTRCHPANVLSGRVNGPIRCLDVSPDDFLLAVGTDSALQLFDIRHRTPLKLFSASTTGLEFNPCQMLLASYGLDRMVRFWCLDQLECVSISDAFEADIRDIAFPSVGNPDNDFLLTATDSELKMLTWEPCDTLATFFLPNNQEVLCASLNEEMVDLISYGPNTSLNLLSCSVEEVLITESSESQAQLVQPYDLAQSDSSASLSSLDEMKTVAGRPPTHPQSDVADRLFRGTTSASRSRTVSASSSGAQPMRANSRSSSPNSFVVPHAIAPNVVTRDPSPSSSLRTKAKPAEKNKTNGEAKKETEKKAVMTVADLLAALKVDHNHVMERSNKRVAGAHRHEQFVRRQGLTPLVKTVNGTMSGSGEDAFQSRNLVRSINLGEKWDIHTTHQLLPTILLLLVDKESAKVALDALQCISTTLMDRLKSWADLHISYGVDVAAEERREKAIYCVQQLTKLRVEREAFYKQMSTNDVYRLDTIMALLKHL